MTVVNTSTLIFHNHNLTSHQVLSVAQFGLSTLVLMILQSSDQIYWKYIHNALAFDTILTFKLFHWIKDEIHKENFISKVSRGRIQTILRSLPPLPPSHPASPPPASSIGLFVTCSLSAFHIQCTIKCEYLNY